MLEKKGLSLYELLLSEYISFVVTVGSKGTDMAFAKGGDVNLTLVGQRSALRRFGLRPRT